MDYEPEQKNGADKPIQWDAKKKKYFEKMVETCRQKGICLIMAYSPMYCKNSSAVYDEMTQFCKEKGIQLLDYYANPKYSRNKAWFSDSSHMNDTGAREYTKEIVKAIKGLTFSK